MRQTLISQVPECFQYLVARSTFHVLADQRDYGVRSLSNIFSHLLEDILKAEATDVIHSKSVHGLVIAKSIPERLHPNGARMCVPQVN
jgi:hypothetical protein